ncbi:MAG: hypothetical protein DCF20_02245 [Pseudanabaena sp.]|nr:MAG: hypothetical protein DCF20_02245 [Pseudanabaena sp.]
MLSSRFLNAFSSSTGFVSGVAVIMVVGATPAAVNAQIYNQNYGQRIDCYVRRNAIQCPGYGSFNYQNSNNNNNNYDQNQIEISIGYLFLQVLGRDADAEGLRNYSDAVRNRRLSLKQVRRELVNSEEADRSIRRNYQQAYGRDPDANQLRNAKRSIENGASLNQIHR